MVDSYPEQIRVWAYVDSTGNDWGYTGLIDLDLTQLVDPSIKDNLINNVKFFPRPSSKVTKKPQNRAFNYKLITEKISMSGHITGTGSIDFKNKIKAIAQAGKVEVPGAPGTYYLGMCCLKYRNEMYDGTPALPATPDVYHSQTFVALTNASFEDDYARPISISGKNTAGGTGHSLTDPTKNFLNVDNPRIGAVIKNKTTGVSGTVSSVSDATTILTSQNFTLNDEYEIYTARDGEMVLKFTLDFTKVVPRT